MSEGIVRTGVHAPLEDAANAILRTALSGITKHSDKSDVLTPWKEKARRDREVYVTSGTPDGAVRRGVFTRAYNSHAPHLNSVEGMTPSRYPAEHIWRGPSAPSPTLWDSE